MSLQSNKAVKAVIFIATIGVLAVASDIASADDLFINDEEIYNFQTNDSCYSLGIGCKSIKFTGNSGDFNINLTIPQNVQLDSVSTKNNGVGNINIDSNMGSSFIYFLGDIGSSTNKIGYIIAKDSSIRIFDGNLFAKAILADMPGSTPSSSAPSLAMWGKKTSFIDANIGDQSSRIGSIELHTNSSNDYSNFNFVNGDVYSESLWVGDGTIDDKVTVNLLNNKGVYNVGYVILRDYSTLNFNQSAEIYGIESEDLSTINIAAGKTISASDPFDLGFTSDINGSLGLSVERSDTLNNPFIVSSENITNSTNALKINFDYSTAKYLKTKDSSALMVAFNSSSPSTTISINPSNITTTDNSFLLNQTISLQDGVSGGKQLMANYQLDTNSFAQLNNNEQRIVSFLINTETAADIDLARTQLLKASSYYQIEKDFNTFLPGENNMIQKTSLDIENAVENIIEYRLQRLNYDQFSSFSIQNHSENKAIEPLQPDPKLSKNSSQKNKKNTSILNNSLAEKLEIDRNNLATKEDKNNKNKKLWGQFFGSRATQNSKGEIDGFNANFGGVSFGFDDLVKNGNINSIYGFSYSYARANANSKQLSAQSANINSHQFMFYNRNGAIGGLGAFNENFLNIGINQYNLSRNIKIGDYQSTANSDFSGLLYGLKTSVGYNFKIREKFLLSPIASFKYSSLSLANYSEKNGGGLGLKVENDRFNVARSEIGIRLIGDAFSNSKIKPQFNFLWLHNLTNNGASSNRSFVNGGSNQDKARNNGSNLDSNILNAGFQLDFIKDKDVSIALKYDLQKSSTFTSHLGSLRFNLGF